MSRPADRPFLIPTYGNSSVRMGITPESGELIFDQAMGWLFYGDGKTLGGRPMGMGKGVFLVDGGTVGYSTIQAAVDAAAAGDTIFVLPKKMAVAATDPVDYAENIIIPATKPSLSIVGIGGRTQGGLPQIKKGSGANPQLTIRSAGCALAGLGINGGGATGGGILLDSDGSTKDAFGLSVVGCHLKNCKVSTTDGKQGGAIYWPAAGGSWQVRIAGNRFYKNVGDIIVVGTGGAQLQDIVIEENLFSDPTECDMNLWMTGAGSGVYGLEILNNIFPGKPALSAGVNKIFFDLTGCTGIMARNFFGAGTSALSFKAAGTDGKIPATMLMTGNYQERAAGTSGEIGRTA
jgi:hypothetical protein